MKPRLYIIAGANGSGKSTISKVLLPAEGVAYVNPDDIARELRPQNPESVKIAAGQMAIQGGAMTEFDVKILAIANKAVYEAQEENRRLGIANVYSLNGTLVWQLPDGTITTVDPNT